MKTAAFPLVAVLVAAAAAHAAGVEPMDIACRQGRWAEALERASAIVSNRMLKADQLPFIEAGYHPLKKDGIFYPKFTCEKLSALRTMAKCYAGQGAAERVLPAYQQLLKDFSTDTNLCGLIRLGIGEFWMQNTNGLKALEALNQALDTQPHLSRGLAVHLCGEVGRCQFALGRYEEARKTYQRILDQFLRLDDCGRPAGALVDNPGGRTWGWAHLGIGHCDHALGRYEAAIVEYRKAIDAAYRYSTATPDAYWIYQEAMRHTAVTCLLMRDYAKAAFTYDWLAVIASPEDRIEACRALAECYDKAGEPEKSRKARLRILETVRRCAATTSLPDFVFLRTCAAIDAPLLATILSGVSPEEAEHLLSSLDRSCRNRPWQTVKEESALASTYNNAPTNTKLYPHRVLWQIETDKDQARARFLTLLSSRSGKPLP